MRKTTTLKTLAAAALTLLASACAKEQLSDNGGQAGVSFTVEVPGAPATKAIGDGTTAKTLYYQVFDEQGNIISKLGAQTTTFGADGKAKVNFQLVKDQTYNFIFWAQTSAKDANGKDYYTIAGTEVEKDLRTITANYEGKSANDENFDAFFAVEKSLKISGPVTKDITLKRPFAQINIGTKGTISAGEASRDIVFTNATSTVTVTGVPTVFSPLANAGTQLGTPATVTFATAGAPEGNITVNKESYKYLAMNYVFASETGDVTDITATLTVEGKNVPLTVPNAPIKRNWRTNIVGNILTTSADFNVVVEPGFDDDTDVDITNVETVVGFNAALANGGKVTLTKDLTVTENHLKIKKENTEISIAAGVTLTGDLSNSNAKRILSYFDNVGHQVLSGEGTIIGPKTNASDAAAAIELEDNNNDLVINGNLTVKGAKGTKSKCVDAAIVIRAGKVTINGGHFISDIDADGKENPVVYMYSPYTYRSELVINGGTFESLSGNNKYLINKDDKTTDNCTISICGGTFIGFDPADNESNGPHTNYVAVGYHSTKVSTDPATGISTYVVTKDGVTPVASQERLTDVINGLKDAAAGSNVSIQLPAGEFTTYGNDSLRGKDVTVSYVGAGADKTTFAVGTDNHVGGEANGDYSLDGVTKASFKNMTIKVDNDNYRGYIRVKELEFENCVFENRISYWGTGTVSFKNCTFNQTNEDYNLWTYSGSEFIFDGCTFNCAGKCVNAYKEQHDAYKMTFKDCIFISSKVNKSVVELKANGGTKYELHFDGKNEVRGFASSKVTGYTQFNSNDGETDSIVSFGTKTVWENGVKVE